MKSAQISLKLITVLAVSVAVVVGVSQRGVRSPAASANPEPAASVSSTETVETPKTIVASPAAPKIQAPAPVVDEAAKSAGEMADAVLAARGDEVELAYQLGMDISQLSPEARVRLKADWEAQMKLARSEAEAVQ
ncbi:MAG: hypothetical protein HYR88_04380 [Verrucomicrobia bacterium]|nr:hypothetical protein [Verrucomicrobiota bacterium]MBI3868232.1 hypothetical protein [Verrucomicrobiota bacterium]